jgi:hypothetical protein
MTQDPVTRRYPDYGLMLKLHGASPQEISAFSHNIAMEIVDELGWDKYSRQKLKNIKVEQSQILKLIKNHLLERGIYPIKQPEIKIYRRYIKLVYLEVQRYLEYLISKK